MIIDLSALVNSGAQSPIPERPIRMGFFLFPNSNLAIRKQCARDLGMYDPLASKGEDVDLCFRLALSPHWVAWRENAAVVRHKGRPTLWALIEQMWGWGLHLGYPYAKTGVRGVFLYLLNGRENTIVRRFETGYFPILVCAFATDFYLVNALVLLLIWAAYAGHIWIGLSAIAGLLWAAPRYLHNVRCPGLRPWDTFKLGVVHYVANLVFTTSAFAGALRYRVILLPRSSSSTALNRLNVVTAGSGRQPSVRGGGASSYTPAEDLWIVTCYFNPQSYATRLENYHRFKAAFERSEARFITVECAFDSQPFVLTDPNVIRLRARAGDVMWQKERLLNLAISRLPHECRKVAWLDCDILFQNPGWMLQTSRLLDRFAFVQPFQNVVYLAKGDTSPSGDLIAFSESFASVFSSSPTEHLAGRFFTHGHTGFAWAARVDLLANHGLYEACVAGGGDHMIAHAACGDWDSPCIDRCLLGPDHRNHFRQWATEFYKNTQSRIGYVPGTILHLWHGDGRRKKFVQAHEFDPARDIRVGSSGTLEWNSFKPELHRSLQNYFAARREDG
jgi:hypothetical protein